MAQNDLLTFGSGSVRETVARLARWSQSERWGLARVEFVSEFARERVANSLNLSLVQRGIAFTQIELPTDQTASNIVRYLIEKLESVDSGVVSVTGFAAAFSRESRLEDSIRVLNFNRENIAIRGLRQIWWMPLHFAEVFIPAAPDLDSWFTMRLQLAEVVPPSSEETRAVERAGELPINMEDARREAGRLQTRFEQVLSSDTSLRHARNFAEQAVGALLRAGAEKEARDLGERLAREIMMSRARPTVFISYSGDSVQHRSKVLNLADRLRGDGIQCTLDQYLDSSLEGWVTWISKELDSADVVLVISSENYLQRYRGQSVQNPGVAKRWEGAILAQDIFSSKGLGRFIPIVFSSKDVRYIPPELRHGPHFIVNTDAEYNLLYRRILDHKALIATSVRSLATGPRKQLRKLSNVPSRNPLFTGREEIMEALNSHLHSGKIVRIVGVGGVGKTQTIVEYAYRHLHNYRVILWTSAISEAVLSLDFLEIAAFLDLPEAKVGDHRSSIIAVRQWLERNDNWLLIIDDVRFGELLNAFVPPNPRGHVLLSSRSRAFDVFPQAMTLQLTPFTMEESISFLRRRTGYQSNESSDNSDAGVLASALECMPLALEQAGACIASRHIVFSEYLNSYRTHLDEKNRSGSRAFALVLAISLFDIEKSSHVAIEILRLSAFLYPNRIPLELLVTGESKGEPQHPDINDKKRHFAFYEILELLTRYSLISLNAISQTYDIHPVIQQILKDKLGRAQRGWAERAVRIVNNAFPNFKEPNRQECDRLVPHALACAELIEVWDMDFPETADLLDRVGSYLRDRGQHATAEPLLRRALRIMSEGTTDEKLPRMVLALKNLAALYSDQGRYSEAEPLLQRALKLQDEKFGEAHPETATLLSNLARIYLAQSDYSKARELFTRVLYIQRRTLGSEHPELAATWANLGLIDLATGNYSEAERLLRTALEIRQRSLGPEHPETARVLFTLGRLSQTRGRTVDAIRFFTRAVEIWRKTDGLLHPDLAAALNHLATLYLQQHEYARAEALLGEALEIQQKNSSVEHSDLAITLNNMGALAMNQARYPEAESLLERSLSIQQETLGPRHPQLRETLNLYANLLRKTNRTAEATAFEAQARRDSE